jgi:hypothetical protein
MSMLVLGFEHWFYDGLYQEKYLRELSVTPMWYFTGATPVGLGCPTGSILHGENEVFQNRYDFPKVTFTLRWNLKAYVGNILQCVLRRRKGTEMGTVFQVK